MRVKLALGAHAMNAEDIKGLAFAISHRHDPRWITPNGPFIDLLRRFAAEGRIAAIPTACRTYFMLGHAAQTSVASALPGIIVNHYGPLIDGVGLSRFIDWTARNPEWADRIRDHACSNGLVHVVNRMATSITRP